MIGFYKLSSALKAGKMGEGRVLAPHKQLFRLDGVFFCTFVTYLVEGINPVLNLCCLAGISKHDKGNEVNPDRNLFDLLRYRREWSM